MKIEKKLGEGAFANVYLANYNNKQVALKIPKNNITKAKADEYAINEIHILNNFTNSIYIVNLIHYEISNTKNNIVVELLGNELHSVLKLFKENKQTLPLYIVKHFTKQILYGLVEMSQRNILHNDLKPENILFTQPLGHLFTRTKDKTCHLIAFYIKTNVYAHATIFYHVLQELVLSQASIKISDFGNAFSAELATQYKEEFTHARPTRHYVSPEILLRSPFWLPADMWSVGCIVYEMLTNSVLFDPVRSNNMGINSAHLASIVETFGTFTEIHLQHAKKRKRYFYGTTHKFNYLIKKNSGMLELLHSYNHGHNEYNFLRPLFDYNTNTRITPATCLLSSWLK